MKTASVPEPRTAAALAARRRKTETALQRVHEAITCLRREKAQISIAAVARRPSRGRIPYLPLRQSRGQGGHRLSHGRGRRVPVADPRRAGRRA